MTTPCANPVYLQLIKEWRDDAKKKNSKAYFIYSKVRIKGHFSLLNKFNIIQTGLQIHESVSDAI